MNNSGSVLKKNSNSFSIDNILARPNFEKSDVISENKFDQFGVDDSCDQLSESASEDNSCKFGFCDNFWTVEILTGNVVDRTAKFVLVGKSLIQYFIPLVVINFQRKPRF